MIEFCQESDIPWLRCGKIIVATQKQELGRLEDLYRRGCANEVPDLRLVDGAEAREIEPMCDPVRAIHSPSTAIVDFSKVARAMATSIQQRGGEIRTGVEVTAIDTRPQSIVATTSDGESLQASQLINCGGLHADVLARKAGFKPTVRLVPFRGEYYVLKRQAKSRIKSLIYPVPDPKFPWLGVHFTPRIDGTVEAGPNAVLAFAREGYSWTTIRFDDLREALGYRGFRALARRHWKVGLYEFYRSAHKPAFVRSLQRLAPAIHTDDLEPGGAGVRALALDPGGDVVDDFIFEQSARALHVINAPSPAATASLAIADHIVGRAADAFDWSQGSRCN